MGFRTVAVGRGQGKQPLAKKLGAHEYVDTSAGPPAEALQKLDRFEVRIVTRFGGPLSNDFTRVAPLCKGAEYCRRTGVGDAEFPAVVATSFAALRPRGLALCNTIAIPEYNEAFMHAGVDVLTLVHELPAYFDASTMLV